MKFNGMFISSLALAAMTACAPQGNNNALRSSGADIVGGSPVAMNDQIAQMTAILYDTRQSSLCTASILSNEWLLTAGHCVEGSTPSSLVVIFTNDINKFKAGATSSDLAAGDLKDKTRRVVSFVQNPAYQATMDKLTKMEQEAEAKGGQLSSKDIDSVTDWGDITLVRISGGLPAGFRAAKMLTNHLFQRGEVVTLAGFGITAKGDSDGAGTLRRVDVTVAEPVWGSTEILFDQTSGRGACHGDSGGPAYVKNADGSLSLFGVTSRGVRDDNDTCLQYAAYTNMQNYAAWVRATAGL